MTVAIAITDDEIQSSYPVMAELRPHVKPDEFLSRVRKQESIAGTAKQMRSDLINTGLQPGVEQVASAVNRSSIRRRHPPC